MRNNEWKAVIIEYMKVNGLYKIEHDYDPVYCIADLVAHLVHENEAT